MSSNDFDLGATLYGQPDVGTPAAPPAFDLGQHLYGALPATSKDTQNEGYLSRVGRISGEAISDIGEQESKPLDTSNPIATLGDISGRGVRGALDMLQVPAAPVQGGLEKGYRSLIDTMAPNAPENQREQASRDFGEVAVGPATAAIGEASNFAKTLKEGLEGLANKYVEGGHEPPPEAKPYTKVDMARNTGAQNEGFVQGINKNLDAMRGTSDPQTGRTVGGYGEIYEKAADTIQDVSTHAPAAKDNVAELLEEMQDDPAHKTSQGSSQAYRDLQAVYDSFDEKGNIPLDKITLLKRRLNDLYSPDMGETRGEIYAKLNNQVNNITKQARKENPEWADLMDSGNNLFLNYKKTTDSLSNAWSVGDKKEFEDAVRAKENDPTAAPATSDVRKKVDAIAKPKDLQQYEDTMRVLPAELQDAYTKAVLDNNPTNSRILSAAKAGYKAFIGNKFGAANEVYNTAMGNAAKRIDPDIAVEHPHVQDAINYHTQKAQAAYKNYLDKLEEAQQQETPPPPKPLALPSPAMFVNKAGEASNMQAPMIAPTETPLETLARNRRERMGITPDVEKAAADRITTQKAAQLAKARANYDEWKGRGSSALGREVMKAGNPTLKSYDVPPFLRDSFARGGAIKSQPVPNNDVTREIITPKRGRDGLFIQPHDNSPARETLEQHNRDRFANHFHYADLYSGNTRTYDPKGDYNCGRCNMADGDKCLLVKPLIIDRNAGSCGDWENQCAGDSEMPLGEKTIETAGYGVAANGKGFGCYHCPYASKAHHPDSRGRDLYCGKGDMRVFSLACCGLNGAETIEIDSKGIPKKKTNSVDTQPSEAQKAIGNYKKGHIKLHGLDITIENPKGSERSGVDKNGKAWKSPPMPADYGYIKGTIGADLDHVDCFIGNNAKSKRVYVLDQKNDEGKFDEHKCFLNCADRDEVFRLYKGSFSDKKNRIMKITRLTIPEFKVWLKEGNTKQPMRKAA